MMATVLTAQDLHHSILPTSASLGVHMLEVCCSRRSKVHIMELCKTFHIDCLPWHLSR